MATIRETQVDEDGTARETHRDVVTSRNGKGHQSRVGNHRRFGTNFDRIDWSKTGCEDQPEKGKGG